MYTRPCHKFYKPNFNTYIIYKPYSTETKVQVEKRGGNYHKFTPGSSLSKRLGPQLPVPPRPAG